MASLPVNNWMDLAENNYALTIADIINMKPGDKLEVLMMDRNVLDTSADELWNKSDKKYSPEKFFRNSRGTYINDKDLSGTMIFHWKGYTAKQSTMPFEFELEYLPCHWYPLKKGKLPARARGAKFPWDKAKHWTEFPPTTKVGFRGAMINWNNLKDMPKVYYSANDY